MSASYALFRDEAVRVAKMLDDVVLISTKRIDLRDTDRISRGTALAFRLRELADIFARWPSLPGDVVSEERERYAPELARRLQEALTIFQSMPTVGALGRVPRIPR